MVKQKQKISAEEKIINFLKENKKQVFGKIYTRCGLNYFSAQNIIEDLIKEKKVEMIEENNKKFYQLKESKKDNEEKHE
jgi:predicted transcriptional regulator